MRSDGVFELDVRCTLKTHDGAYIYMRYVGIVAAPSADRMAAIVGYASGTHAERVEHADYYQRTSLLFETGDPRYTWLNKIIAVGTGGMEYGGVSYSVHALL
jgi:Protein of unknown function (DUF3237)